MRTGFLFLSAFGLLTAADKAAAAPSLALERLLAALTPDPLMLVVGLMAAIALRWRP
ncbi:MAG: hypothetical protein JNM82_12135 [Rhodocyclaceae bacterium]|nr:hypothetical protein [Rhodocyclaceae bacterium]